MKFDDIEQARQRPERLAAVDTSELRDLRQDQHLDRLTRLAVETIGVPAAFVSVIDRDADLYISQTGLSEPIATSRRVEGRTFCHYTLVSDGVLAIEDARSHPILCDVPTVKSMGVVAYVGVPLKSGDETLGAFCVIDRKPRKWTEAEVNTLVSLARVAFGRGALSVERSEGARTETDDFYDEIGPVLFSLFLRVLKERQRATRLLASFVAERWSLWSGQLWRRPGRLASILSEAHDLAVAERERNASTGDAPGSLVELPSCFTESERRILALSYFDGLPVERIAAETSSSVRDVRETLTTAMRKLRREKSRPT